MSIWSFIVYFLLPIGLLFLLFLTIPLPASITNTVWYRSFYRSLLNKISSILLSRWNHYLPLPIYDGYSVYLYSSRFYYQSIADQKSSEGRLWRKERNCYLVWCCFIVYWSVFSIVKLKQKLLDIEEQLEYNKKDDNNNNNRYNSISSSSMNNNNKSVSKEKTPEPSAPSSAAVNARPKAE